MKPNVFRSQYRELSETEKEQVKEIKNEAAHLYDVLAVDPASSGVREMALARTKLEECVMWATKAITG